MHEVLLHIAHGGAALARLAAHAGVLDAGEQASAARFRFAADRELYQAAHVLLRSALIASRKRRRRAARRRAGDPGSGRLTCAGDSGDDRQHIPEPPATMGPTLHARLTGMATEMQDFAADLGGWMRDGARRLGGADKRRLAERFSAWALAEENITDAGLRAWIEDLDGIGREALAEQVAGFCADFELELAWLVDGELADWPALEAGLRSLVGHYCLACKAAVDCDADVMRFRRRRLWQQRLGS